MRLDVRWFITKQANTLQKVINLGLYGTPIWRNEFAFFLYLISVARSKADAVKTETN